ncbi:DUF3265 domain-containing protein [Vibrio parahaemolyticus]
MTKHLSAIHNAWHFWFAPSFVFKAQCGSRCVLRCSRLNAALCVSHKKESSMKKPTIESSQEELIAFVRDWIDLCASGEAEYAFSFLDEPLL